MDTTFAVYSRVIGVSHPGPYSDFSPPTTKGINTSYADI